ncbi:MAG: hypothetical protein HY658_10705 [Actinobacteria bacterium]|nr:hypothetical protein [Actinomycetota bacterium]
MTARLEIELAPTEGGTRLTLAIDLRPRWFLAPVNAVLWPLLMRRRTRASMEVTAANAKRIVESIEPEDVP